MVKKCGFTLLGVVVALALLSRTQLGEYTMAYLSQAYDSSVRQVPVQIKIQNLKAQVARLDTELDRNRGIVAGEIVDVEKLQAAVEGDQKKLAQQKTQLSQIVAQLKKDEITFVTYNGKQVTPDRAREKLSQDLATAQAYERLLESKKRQLDARERLVEVSRKKLQALADAKADLMSQIAQLEADHEELQLQATQSKVQIDDSQLAKIKQEMEAVRDQLRRERVKQDLADNTPLPTDNTKLNKEIVQKTEQFLNGDKDDKVAADRK